MPIHAAFLRAFDILGEGVRGHGDDGHLGERGIIQSADRRRRSAFVSLIYTVRAPFYGIIPQISENVEIFAFRRDFLSFGYTGDTPLFRYYGHAQRKVP